jgi:hypothetical protein
MSFFESLGNLTKAALNLAYVPVEIIKDVVTIPVKCSYPDEPWATVERLKKVQRKIDNALD